jgi:quinol monooxygenase YgiN
MEVDMVTLVIEHGMQDWAAWKPVFDAHASSRKEHGCISEELFQADGDAHMMMNVMRWPDRASAESFLADPSLPEAFRQAGVTGEPRFTLWETVETTRF